MGCEQKRIRIADLESFCEKSLIKEGMDEEDARITAEVLAETDAFGTHSHGTKTCTGISKVPGGGMDIKARPEVEREGPAFAIIDAKNALGTVASYRAMNLAYDKAKETGIAIVCVKNSSHFGAAGYYANMAAKRVCWGCHSATWTPI